MPILSKPSSAARMSVLYVTVGALMCVWASIWYAWLRHIDPEGSSVQYYWCLGFFLSGVVLLVIGLALGRIGRAARHAELPLEAPGSPTAEPAVTGGTPAIRTASTAPPTAVPAGYPVTGQVVVPVPPAAVTAPVAQPPASRP
jgi:hypothetical protein